MSSKRWDKKRKARLKRDGYMCQKCGEKNKPLDVHHVTYDRFGKERIGDLISLCRKCHDKEHGKTSRMFDVCQTCGNVLLVFVQKLAGGWVRKTCADGHIREKRQW
jgi:hypothetical protein